jgi:hypothetical protein
MIKIDSLNETQVLEEIRDWKKTIQILEVVKKECISIVKRLDMRKGEYLVCDIESTVNRRLTDLRIKLAELRDE